jgi:hypothetical protein
VDQAGIYAVSATARPTIISIVKINTASFDTTASLT